MFKFLHFISIFALIFLFSPACVPIGVTTNVPGDRLSKKTYTSPGGEYTVKIPPLMRPGTRIQERQISPLAHGVAFADDFGRVYTIMISDNQKAGFTLDKIAKDFQVGEFLRVKKIIDTDRGSELRLMGIEKEGSPIVTRSNASGAWVTKKNDLIVARTIFLQGKYIYDIKAGVTPLFGVDKSESELMALADRNLDGFLWGLVMNSR
ncbi:MAG: hypothetical protein V3S64_02660 [bacterium]